MPEPILTDRNQIIRRVCKRLLTVLIVLLVLVVVTSLIASATSSTAGFGAATPALVFLVGTLGGFVSIQRRLPELADEELTLIANSFVYTILAPLVGGILAVLLYLIFMGELLAGELFPKFLTDTLVEQPTKKLSSIFETHANYKDYAKLFFWAFVAGFSERFVTGIIGQMEQNARDKAKVP